MAKAKTHVNFFLILLGAALVLGFIIIRPYITTIIVGGILAAIFSPLYDYLRRFVRKESLTAVVTLILVFIVVLIPLFFLGSQVFQESKDVYSSLTSNGTLGGLFESTKNLITKYIPGASFDISNAQIGEYARQVLGKVIENIGPVFSGIAQIALHIVLSLMAFYYFLKDGDKLKEELIKLSPLKEKENREIIEKIKTAITSVVRGSLVIGIIQGILTGIGFSLFGIPNPALWGSLAVIAALVPGAGTALIIIPGVLFLAFSGSLVSAFLLLIWGFVAVGLIDNFLGPRLMGRGTKMHQFMILLSVLGGITIFGPVGFLIGPLILSFILALIDIYPAVILKRR